MGRGRPAANTDTRGFMIVDASGRFWSRERLKWVSIIRGTIYVYREQAERANVRLHLYGTIVEVETCVVG